MTALEKRIKDEQDAKKSKCACLGCDNQATHTWSGYPTCDRCGSPHRVKRDIPNIIGT